MGDDPKSTDESTHDLLAALTEHGPGAIQALSNTIPYVANQELLAAQQTQPGQSALERAAAIEAMNTELALSRGPGAEAVTQADTLQRQLDPEFYRNREVLGGAIDSYLSGYDPYKLSDTEIEQINRGIASQQGKPLVPSALTTVQNAQTFGNAATQRWQNFGNAISQASTALPALRSGLTGYEIATRRPVSNTFNQIASGASQNALGTGQNILSNITSTENANVAKREPWDAKVSRAFSSLGSAAGGIGSLV